jgi:hypothetical protein
MKWNTRAEAKDFIENSYKDIDEKPVVADSSKRSGHCAKYKCLCHTFCLEITRRKKKGNVYFLIDDRKSNIEHLLWSKDSFGNQVEEFCNPNGFIESERCFDCPNAGEEGNADEGCSSLGSQTTGTEKKKRKRKSYFFQDRSRAKLIPLCSSDDSENDTVTFLDSPVKFTPQKSIVSNKGISKLGLFCEPLDFVGTPAVLVSDQEKLESPVNQAVDEFIQEVGQAVPTTPIICQDKDYPKVQHVRDSQECFAQLTPDVKSTTMKKLKNESKAQDHSLFELNMLWKSNADIISISNKLPMQFEKLPTSSDLEKLGILLEEVRIALNLKLANSTSKICLRSLRSG